MQTHAAATIDCSDCQCQPNYVYRLISDQSSSPSVVTLARPQSLNAWSWNMKMASVEIGLRSLELKSGFGPLPPPPSPIGTYPWHCCVIVLNLVALLY